MGGGRDSKSKHRLAKEVKRGQRPQTAKPRKEQVESGSLESAGYGKQSSTEGQSIKRIQSINSLKLKQHIEKKSRPRSAYTPI